MADRIGSLEHLITPIIPLHHPLNLRGFLYLQPQPKRRTYPWTPEELKANHPDLVTKMTTDAKAEERKRFEDILGSDEAKGREKLAQEIAMGTDLSAMEAKQLLSCASPDVKAGVSDFETAMAATKKSRTFNPIMKPPEDDVNAIAARIANMGLRA